MVASNDPGNEDERNAQNQHQDTQQERRSPEREPHPNSSPDQQRRPEDQSQRHNSSPARPPRQQGSGGVFSDESRKYLYGIIGIFVVISISLFVMVLLLGSLGGPSLTLDQELTEAQQDQIGDLYEYNLIQGAILITPYIGFVLVIILGLIVSAMSSRPKNEKYKLSAIAGFAGVFIFVFLTVFLLSTQIPEISGSLQSGTGTSIGTSLDSGQLLTNSVVFGLVAALISTGSTYISERFPTIRQT